MKAYTGPIILIGLGVYFLLQQFEILSFHFRDLLTFGFILVGILMLLTSFDNPERKGLLGGVFFISCGAVMSLMRYHYIYPDDNFGYGAKHIYLLNPFIFNQRECSVFIFMLQKLNIYL